MDEDIYLFATTSSRSKKGWQCVLHGEFCMSGVSLGAKWFMIVFNV